MMILSRYSHLLELDGQQYLFNVSNRCVIALNDRLVQLIKSHQSNVDSIKEIHPDLYDSLVKCGVLVNEEIDEAAEMIARFEELDNNPEVFGLTINPTLDCNLRCWYCYETHCKGTMMSPAVIEALKLLIDKKISDGRIKQFSISFFGGEPLLGWDNVVMPLLRYGVERCSKHGVEFRSGFTTNGVLLTKNRLDDLTSIGLSNTSFQISIDGNRTLHDNSRVNGAKHPTYDRIMANVALAAAKGFHVSLRFNYTPNTIDAFTDVLVDLEKLPIDSRKNIVCNFHQVWQTIDDNQESQIRHRVEKVAAFFHESGFESNSEHTYYRYVCYGDRTNHAVVNYNGDLYKCTAREFSPSTREGVLTHDGELKWNSRFTDRMAIKYADKACRECSIMPVCNGGCSQNKIERHSSDLCPKGMVDTTKHHYLLMALKQHLYQ